MDYAGSGHGAKGALVLSGRRLIGESTDPIISVILDRRFDPHSAMPATMPAKGAGVNAQAGRDLLSEINKSVDRVVVGQS